MTKLIFLVVLLAALCEHLIFAQTNHKVEVEASGFKISVNEFKPAYKDLKSGAITIRDYSEFTDPSNPGSYKLPFQNIFLAIPENSAIEINQINFKSEFEDKIIPALNPSAIVLDSTIIYKESDYSNYRPEDADEPVISIEKYFWFREFYIVHLKINLVRFQQNKSSIESLSDISFYARILPEKIIIPQSQLMIKTDFDKALSELISNEDMAEQFRNRTTDMLEDTTGSWINYSAAYLKIGVIEDAVHRITQNDLSVLGINTANIDPQTFQMYESGRELKIFVSGEDDGVFDPSDFIEFWGHKNYGTISYHIINDDDKEYNEYLNRYSDTSFYFLTWNITDGERADTISSDPSGASDTLFHYSRLLHFELNPFFDFNNNNEVANQTPDWKKNKTWYRHTLITQRTYNVTLDEIYPNQTSKINAKAVSWASSIETNSHQVKLFINNVMIDSNSIDRFKQIHLSGIRNSSNLISGTNQIKLENLPNGSDPNGLLVDWFEIEYPRNLRLTNDSLYFKVSDEVSPGFKVIRITNANASGYRIYKIKPEFKVVTNYTIASSVLSFADTVNAGDEYYVLSTAKSVSPKFIRIKNFDNFRSITAQTDYIAITHPDFINDVQDYITTVSNLYDLSSLTFNVFNVFDEFSFGYPYPEGIRLFLNVFFNNVQSPKPQFLNLIGDSNYDYKNFTNSSVKNYVTSFGNPVGDNWFAVWDLNGPPVPQLKVGRIPISNPTQLNYYLSKVEANESSQFDEWNKRYLFFSGGIDANEYELLKSVNDSLINLLIKPRPVGGKFTHFYKTISPPSDFGPYTPEEIQNAINNGGVFISYIGHSGTATWDNSINETNQLYNGLNRNPLITDFGCSTNKYAEPQIVCFGERFLFNATGQAISYVGNSSLGFQSTAVSVPELFYETIFSDSLSEIGYANLISKIRLFAQYGNTGVNRVFSLSNIILGDPAVRLKIPRLPNFKITSADVLPQSQLVTDIEDSSEVRIAIKNLGLAENGSLEISITQSYLSNVIKNVSLSVQIPIYSDTLSFWLLTKDRPGNHTLIISIDPANSIDEIYENDNDVNFQFNVASGSLRDFLTTIIVNPSIQSLRLLNPTSFGSFIFPIETQISSDVEFTNPVSVTINSDTIATDVIFPSLSNDTRYYVRYRIDNPGTSFSGIKSFFNNGNSKFLLNDSVSFNQQSLNNLSWENDSLRIVPDTINISVLSSGFYTGATCVIAKDGINLLSNSFFAGMGIAVFDNITFEVDTANWFYLFNNPANVEALANLIDSIPSGKIVAMGVADDGRNNMTTHLSDAIKSLGSSKIDSLQFRGSWAIIGWKGAPTGSVLEKVLPPLPPQSVFIDTSYVIQSESGNFITDQIGPAAKWKIVEVSENLPFGSESEYFLYGLTVNQQTDSLGLLNFSNGISDISFLDAELYPKIFIDGRYSVLSGSMTPSVNKVSVDFTGLPDLAINYQVVNVLQDTVTTGEDVNLNFLFSNVGEIRTDSFKIKVELLHQDNSRQTLLEQSIDSLGTDQRLQVNLNFNTAQTTGNKLFQITIDSENMIREFYEDNNFYSVPFYIRPDTTTPSLVMTIDGGDILDGEYISPRPIIHIELTDQSLIPITDPSFVEVYLNDELIPSDTSIINYQFSTTNPKVIVDFTPVLADGEYYLKVLWKDSRGNIVDSSGVEKYFQVSNEAKLLLVYNYPNPFINETHFTFKLTRIPDEIKIKIFTIAGRLIKELIISSAGLDYDFNKISWDGKDEDGDLLANGVYLYKVIMKAGDKTEDVTQKLTIMR